jgi:polyisoprenoid-binding protein YceI
VAKLIVVAALLALAEPVLIAEPRAWSIDYAASRLEFVAQQAGANFRGRFERFEADVRFDPDALDRSAALVRIDTASIATLDDERDEILRGEGWFETDTYAQATFEATQFEARNGGFRARGTLTIRDLTLPVVFDFEPTRSGIRGAATLDRLAFGLGTGDWADAKWIGHAVRVEVALERLP